ncbi:hypothetical protein OOK31_00035 [Streptomyces sp. NBC_00249]|uniref:hypothetical protein n=1 Tax=Streptomyces sp. NBC_00249 TaxID=2975690 RepID=UPI00224E174D|nr:hypothetical protein [Streptomyces sp. NBC_00249]MCX5192297.1 hypothetical protein [Streptomyces sp. NBC_00249]
MELAPTRVEEEIVSAISDVLKDPEIVSGMSEAGTSVEDLKGELGRRRADLDAASSVEFSRLRDLEERYYGMGYLLRWKSRRMVSRRLLGLGLFVGLMTVVTSFFDGGNSQWTLGGIALLLLASSAVTGYTARNLRERYGGGSLSVADYPLLEGRVEAAREEWRSALRKRAVAGLAREEINRRLPSYSLTLDIGEPKGLAELEDPQFLVAVPAESEIEHLISTMPGGSIGISGPRGVGKTTLLRHFCSKEHAPPGEFAEEKPPLRIMLSAPVKYDAREFVLLLFSKVCGAVAPQADRLTPDSEPQEVRKARVVNVAVMLVLVLAMGLGLFLLLSTVYKVNLPPNLELAAVLICAPLIALPVWWRYRKGWLHDPGQDEYREIESRFGKDAAEASVLLRGLAYQQSVSRAWSAGVKIPVGVEGAMSSNITMTERPLGFPELVGDLNDFLRKLSVSRRIFIGIDELDKIDSDEQVYQFINDIKGIFGREECFYLISVSDNAMSSFERRGLPIRDAFDSSLDTVVTLYPAELSMSKTVMRRRVIGMPEAFLCLCHAVSGGLPRDLIRAARELVSLARGKEGAERMLGPLTQAMVHADLRRKARAAEIIAQQVDLEPHAGEFVCSLRDILAGFQPARAQSLLAAANELTLGMTTSASVPDHARSAHDTLSRLRLEMGAYMYFCATLIETFDDSLVRTEVERLKSDGGCLARLAQVRSDFAVNPRMAWSTISAFREARGLASTPYPM